jgi:hypothetical protein
MFGEASSSRSPAQLPRLRRTTLSPVALSPKLFEHDVLPPKLWYTFHGQFSRTNFSSRFGFPPIFGMGCYTCTCTSCMGDACKTVMFPPKVARAHLSALTFGYKLLSG